MTIEPATRLTTEPADALVSVRLVQFLLIGFLVTNRLMDRLITVPVGISIHPSELVLIALGGVWTWCQLLRREPMPRGVVALAGLAVLVILLVSPNANAGNLSPFQAQTFDQGIIIVLLYALLFVVSYQAGRSEWRSHQVVTTVLAMSAFQGIVALIENFRGAPFRALDNIWLFIGLQVDPRSSRELALELDTRLTGELRVQATAPHPLVLSAIVAVSLAITLQLLLSATSPRLRRRYAVLTVINLVAMAPTNSRTGFFILALTLPVIAILNWRRLYDLVIASVVGVAGLGALFVVSPSTPRLILNSFTGQAPDHNVDVRLERIPLVMGFLEDRPLLGAGYLTHDNRITFWDNAYLHGLAEMGILGFTSLLFFLVSATIRCLTALSASGFRRDLAIFGFMGGAGLLIGGTTFDAWTFGQFLPMCLVLLALGVSQADVHVDTVRARRSPALNRERA